MKKVKVSDKKDKLEVPGDRLIDAKENRNHNSKKEGLGPNTKR